MFLQSINHRHIYQDKCQGGDLHKHLRCQKKQRKRYGKQDRRGRIPNRIGIDERPAIVANKSRIGGDTIIGKGHQGLVTTHIEQQDQIHRFDQIKHAKPVRQSIVQGLIPYRNQIHTINYDNGLDFSQHQTIARNLSANIYFAHPYSSWEWALNENTNGLIRQYLPKLRPLNNVTQKEMNYIMDQLNHRTRKTLGFRTP